MSADQLIDRSGRSRLASNLFVTWGAHFLVLIAGFVVPRQISDNIGQEALGVWDISWSIIRYLSISNFGFVGATSRYASLYQAGGDMLQLSRLVSTAIAWQLGLGIFVLFGAILLFLNFSSLVTQLAPELQVTASLVVLLLGASLAVEMSADFARGILTGFHRWDVNSGIAGLTETLTAAGLVACLVFGGNLVTLAAVVLFFSVCGALLRIWASRRFFDYKTVSISHLNWPLGKKLAYFGLKQSATHLPMVFTTQGLALFTGVIAGPAVLAVFARPLALVTHIDTLVRKYTNMLATVSGSLVGSGESGEIRELFLSSSRFTASMAFPMLAMLGIYGDTIINLWMGPEYVFTGLPLILSVGFLLPLLGGAAVHVMIGLNQHGRIALLSNILGIALLIAGFIFVKSQEFSLINVGIALAVSMSLVRGVIPLWIACSRLKVGIGDFAVVALLVPTIVTACIVAICIVVNSQFGDRSVTAMLCGGVLSGVVMLIAYWNFLLTSDMRFRIRGRTLRVLGR